ncbi:MAG: DUF4143 domain-containing protein [Gammaproteobacteria bacterium]|nr:DUF4143 domain-containing protein [Gammaproteobacteria bacterium]
MAMVFGISHVLSSINMEKHIFYLHKSCRKGFIAENFVQAELNYACEEYPTYGWEEGQAEIEFLYRCQDGETIPVEVKSGSRSRARSLRSYLDRYNPIRAIKLVGSAGGENDGAVQTWPLYGVQFLCDL